MSLHATRAALALGAVCAAVNAAPAVAALPRCGFPRVLRRVPNAGRSVALTFDDGPHPEATPAILACLNELGLRATFFVVGEQAVRHPAAAREIVAAGHELALHGHRHLPHALVPPRLVMRDLARGREEIEAILGGRLGAVRAPFGAASLATLRFASRHGLVVAGWSRWGWDWASWATPASIARCLTRDVGAGDVLVLHDSDAYAAPGSWRRTAAALPMVADTLSRRGLAAHRLADMLPRANGRRP